MVVWDSFHQHEMICCWTFEALGHDEIPSPINPKPSPKLSVFCFRHLERRLLFPKACPKINSHFVAANSILGLFFSYPAFSKASVCPPLKKSHLSPLLLGHFCTWENVCKATTSVLTAIEAPTPEENPSSPMRKHGGDGDVWTGDLRVETRFPWGVADLFP